MQCETRESGTDGTFAISDGCYQHRNILQAQTCSSHGFCNHDSTCHCVCGYSVANCSYVHVATTSLPHRNRFFSGAPMWMPIGNNATGGFVALVRQQKIGTPDCRGAGSLFQQSYSTDRSQQRQVKWGIEIQQDTKQHGGAKLSVISRNGSGQIQLPHDPSTPLAPAKYTMCFCNAEKVT